MEWIETTGTTLEEATERALDLLGIDETELELEVVEEPRPGLFGRTRGEARVRARVAPRAPRPKAGGRAPRRRGRSGGKGSGGNGRGGRASKGSSSSSEGTADRTDPAGDEEGAALDEPTAATTDGSTGTGDGPEPSSGSGGSGGRKRSRGGRGSKSSRGKDEDTDRGRRSPRGGEDDVSAETIAEKAETYLQGLVEAMEIEGAEVASEIDGNEVLATIDGDDLGLLIGPKGATLQALQDLTRLSVSRPMKDSDARLHVDVSGYREKRREALARWATDQAQSVLDSGDELELEPMNPADRKVVHDAINEVDGVSTVSEGREGSRRVVIIPD